MFVAVYSDVTVGEGSWNCARSRLGTLAGRVVWELTSMSQEAVYQQAPKARVVHDAPTHRAAARRRLAAASLRCRPTTPRSLEPPSPFLALMSSSNRPRLTRYASDLRKSTRFLASEPHGARPELPRLAYSPLF